MNKGHKETISIRFVSCAFMVLAIAIFKPFGLEVWQWQAYVHLLAIFVLGLFSCFLTEVILRYIVRMPRSYDRGVSYIISRNLRFQCINTPLVALFICLYRHFAMSSLVEGNKLSLSNYLETLVIIAFLSFAVGLYWRFKFRSRYLSAELEETKLLNEQLKKLQTSSESRGQVHDVDSSDQATCPHDSVPSQITLEGTTNEHVTLEISNLFYIEAVGNYVKVCQLQGNEVHANMLRATMKQMEDSLQAYPMIVRCHRAFMVNLGQVEQISSNSRAMQLVMHHSHDAIPVSRSNVNKLKELLE
ncbi:MAG: LytTR family transcriptional regulator [Prevotella sp.]|nr:LytTR family transcriptional regulator [Prevotella sp.]